MNTTSNQRKANFYLISGLIILVLIIIITVQNTDSATFHLLFWEVQAPMIIMLLVMFLFGFFYGQIRSFFSNRDIRKELEAKNKLINKLSGRETSQENKHKSSGSSTQEQVKNPS